MKKLLLISSLFLLTGCEQWKKFSMGVGTPQNQGPISIAVFGQSNAVSSGGGVYSAIGTVQVTDYYCEYSTTPCIEGQNLVSPVKDSPLKSNQAWIILGDILYGYLGHKVIFYNTAHDGYSTQQLIDNGELDKTLVNLRRHPEIQTLIYVQGESERYLTPEQSYQNLKYMIEQTQGVNPKLQWVLNLNWFEREAQERIVNEHLALRGVDMDALRLQTGAATDFAGYPQMQAMAKAWADVLMQFKPWND